MKVLKRASVLAAGLIFFWMASAQADILNLGGSFTYPMYLLQGTTPVTEGGGSIDPSYLNGSKLAYLYCIEPHTVVYVPVVYDGTVVTTNGYVHGMPVATAGQIAWLLGHYGNGGQGENAYALQAAIWHLVDPAMTIDPSLSTANEVYLYNYYLTSLGSNTGNISDFLWISPLKTGSDTIYQGLVGPASSTPIPAAGWLLASGLVGLIGVRRKFTKK
jgi:hypothetical protein